MRGWVQIDTRSPQRSFCPPSHTLLFLSHTPCTRQVLFPIRSEVILRGDQLDWMHLASFGRYDAPKVKNKSVENRCLCVWLNLCLQRLQQVKMECDKLVPTGMHYNISSSSCTSGVAVCVGRPQLTAQVVAVHSSIAACSKAKHTAKSSYSIVTHKNDGLLLD